MDVFQLRDKVITEYSSYMRSFLQMGDHRIRDYVEKQLDRGHLWPKPLLQLNPSFALGDPLATLVQNEELHPECLNIFSRPDDSGQRQPLHLYRHQVDGFRAAAGGNNYVLTTGTGSGKSLSYIVPIVDHVLRLGSGRGVQAIIVYPMNALANSQIGELDKFLKEAYPQGPPVSYNRYTSQEQGEEREQLYGNPPDILLTNYVMLEYILTRPKDQQLIRNAAALRFIVLDELHTYRGRQGADVALLLRRLRQICGNRPLIHVGTSATIASEGSQQQQREEVAQMASRLFGVPFSAQHIIGETLVSLTQSFAPGDSAFFVSLKQRILSQAAPLHQDTAAFLQDPLTRWVESELGLRLDPQSKNLVRAIPRPLSGEKGIVEALARDTGLDRIRCELALRQLLLRGHQFRDPAGRSLFSFRLHQFISKGERVYASLEQEETRFITLNPQKYVPGSDRCKTLLPLVFCRECGQDYYVVRREMDEAGRALYLGRQLSDLTHEGEGEHGFLYLSSKNPWPDQPQKDQTRLPDDWLEFKKNEWIVRKDRSRYLPQKVLLSADGREGGTQTAWWLPAPFRLCLKCGVAYDLHQKGDYGKLATLGSEGRSTATTILGLSTIRQLRQGQQLKKEAQKLLSFTDNRQDAALQAGNFNDFVEVSLLRSGLYQAVKRAGDQGILHDQLTIAVFECLKLSPKLYSINPQADYFLKEEIDKAFRQVMGYYLYRDLQRGWRVTSPNLEQCGLLQIQYRYLDRLCSDEALWSQSHQLLAQASCGNRSMLEEICKTLLDHIRRELAVDVSYLDSRGQDSIKQQSSQYLIAPWALDSDEKMEQGRILFPSPRPKNQKDSHNRYLYLSPRGRVGLWIRKKLQDDNPSPQDRINLDEMQLILAQICEILCSSGFLRKVIEPQEQDRPPGYKLAAHAMIWRMGEGTNCFEDPIRVPVLPRGGSRPNQFFVEFYREHAGDLTGMTAHEHTAQVPAHEREQREQAFREGQLPVMFCSPTMELGVDIAQLNVVNMRNVPPTPANYAQRSGRAGRSGQPAFVFTYCSAGSPHDQYFFKRPHLMVSGSVSPPRLDLANEDLVKAHIHAIWLQESKVSLGQTLKDVVIFQDNKPTQILEPSIQSALDDARLLARTRTISLAALGEVIEAMVTDETAQQWLDRILQRIGSDLNRACDRWRDLYLSALEQFDRQTRIARDPSRSADDRNRAARLLNEAKTQMNLLLETSDNQYSDFYSYRYFASEGFLPGYNFPRLPLSAFLPARGHQKGNDDFVSRPRFIAISEFGPRSILYHEGARYMINKVILPVDEEEFTQKAARCDFCGYLHLPENDVFLDLCQHCGQALGKGQDNLFRMKNVATIRRKRISSDEEERLRLGHDLRTSIRFARRGGTLSARPARLMDGDRELASLVYGHGATLWRMNLGLRRRREAARMGYVLDMERGYWGRESDLEEHEDPLSPQTRRVIPFVEDTRNSILINPGPGLSRQVMASLEAALKTAIQICYQLEDRELCSEALPDFNDRRQLLFYESSEGGAGALKQLLEEPGAMAQIARKALELCHFNPDTGEDLGHNLGTEQDNCVAACYDCLRSYFNQRDHEDLDRMQIRDLLLAWSQASLDRTSATTTRAQHLAQLLNRCDSDLERRWLQLLDHYELDLPDQAQPLISACRARPDFYYAASMTCILIDGPHHDSPAWQTRDSQQQDLLEDYGYTVLRFHHNAPWLELFKRYPSVFGKPAAHALLADQAAATSPSPTGQESLPAGSSEA